MGTFAVGGWHARHSSGAVVVVGRAEVVAHTASPPAVSIATTAIARACMIVVLATTVFVEAAATMRAVGAGRRWLLIIVRRHIRLQFSCCCFGWFYR